MKHLFSRGMILFLAGMLYTCTMSAQFLTVPPDGDNRKASVSERIGLTDVMITFDRPGVKGREGKIWGQLVHYGYKDLGFGSSKAAPWRAGANENTTISFSTDVKIEGKPLAAGKYGLFMAMYPDSAVVIFSRNSTSWGSFFYDPAEDALQVTVRPVKTDILTERLKYEFSDQVENAAVVSLVWEKLRIPFKIEVDLEKTVVESFRRELRSDKGFTWESWNQAASWCVGKQTNLEEALSWADKAVNDPFMGSANFTTLGTKAAILFAMGRKSESEEAMKNALPLASMVELHGYGRQLINQKRPKDALDAFKLNYDKHPNEYTTNVGMARGLSANADYKGALKYLEAALPKAPDQANKINVERMIGMLREGKDIN